MTEPSARSRGPTSRRTGTPLSSQSVARRPNDVVDLGVELDPHAGGAQLGGQRARPRSTTSSLVAHGQHHHLDGRQPRGHPQARRRRRGP